MAGTDTPFVNVSDRYPEAWGYQTYDRALAKFIAETVAGRVGQDERRHNVYIDRIPLVFATPERAYSETRKQNKLAENEPIPLPRFSLQRIGTIDFDPQRYNNPLNKITKMSLPDANGSTVTMPWPLPHTFTYQLEAWAKNLYQHNIIAMLLSAATKKQGGYFYLNVKHGNPLGEKIVRTEMRGPADNSDLEPGDRDRTLRWSYDFTVHGWLGLPMEREYIVESVDLQINMPGQ